MADLSSNNSGGLFFVAIAIVVLAFVGADAVRDVKRANDTIQVTGSAKMRVSSDYVTWRANLRTSAGSLQQASRNLQAHRDKVDAFLAGHEVSEDDIVWQAPNIWDQQEYVNGSPTGRILSYNASQTLIVRSSNLDLVAKVASGAESLMAQGVPINPQSPEYTYSKLDQARIDLMEAATTDAKARAEKIAAAAGNEVGAIREARMGVIQVVAPNSTNVSDYGMYDTSTIEKDVIAVVKVSFAVE